MGALYHTRRRLMSVGIENMLRLTAALSSRDSNKKPYSCPINHASPIDHAKEPTHPEDFNPLDPEFFQNPYGFYELLRNEYPIYQLKNGIYCVSRYQDITHVCRDTETFSSSYQGIIPGLKPHQSIEKAGKVLDAVGRLGIAPSNVLALSDPPRHSIERKISATGLNTGLARELETEIKLLADSLLDDLLREKHSQFDFMAEFAWKLPMQIVMQLLGYPLKDYEKIKALCSDVISLQTGIATSDELKRYQASSLALMRYCWKQYLMTKKRGATNNATGIFIKAVSDKTNHIDDQIAVSSIFQTLIAGSDSSATSMGNAVKILIENPNLMAEISRDYETKLPAFIEEVFRLEAAFQGHFRWARKDTELNGTVLPKGSRLFLMWASANRDESVFKNPTEIDLNRPNGKKHMTFGFGLHACAGRELARSEMNIALKAFLQRSQSIKIIGPTPFIASMFTHSLQQLPIEVISH